MIERVQIRDLGGKLQGNFLVCRSCYRILDSVVWTNSFHVWVCQPNSNPPIADEALKVKAKKESVLRILTSNNVLCKCKDHGKSLKMILTDKVHLELLSNQTCLAHLNLRSISIDTSIVLPDTLKELKVYGCMCKHFKGNARLKMLDVRYSDVHLKDYSTLSDTESFVFVDSNVIFMKKCLQNMRNLKHLTIKEDPVDPELLPLSLESISLKNNCSCCVAVMKRLPLLKKVCLDHHDYDFPPEFFEAASESKTLIHLDMNEAFNIDENAYSIFDRLEVLKIGNSEFDIERILKNNNVIRNLCVFETDLDLDNPLVKSFLKRRKNGLEKLSVNSVRGGNPSVDLAYIRNISSFYPFHGTVDSYYTRVLWNGYGYDQVDVQQKKLIKNMKRVQVVVMTGALAKFRIPWVKDVLFSIAKEIKNWE